MLQNIDTWKINGEQLRVYCKTCASNDTGRGLGGMIREDNEAVGMARAGRPVDPNPKP